MMGLNVRKFIVGLLALGVLAGVFLLYTHLGRTPPIIVEPAKRARGPADGNEGESPEPVGKFLGRFGIGTVRNTEFLHRDGAGRIDRRFGFEELLHEQGDQWEITKPYMDLLFPEASCQVTADRGRIQVDTTLRQPTLTDAVFRGNVVLHITPRDPNNPWECFIHLDDVVFLAEKSLFSSTGAVRFLSRTVRLTGTGMELIYDMPRSRLERFQVFDLDSLRFRSSDVKALAEEGRSGSKRRGGSVPAAGLDPNATPSVVEIAGQPSTPADSNAPPGDVYRCVFRGNIRLDSPYGAAVAKDMLSINNIRWSGSNRPTSPARQAADPNADESVASPPPRGLNTTASPHVAMSSIPEELYDVVVTCDGGADISLLGGPHGPATVDTADASGTPPAVAIPPDAMPPADQYLVARRIDYDFLTNDTTMLGPFAMRVLVDPNVLDKKAEGKLMPAVVTAQDAVRFLAAAKRIMLEGGSTATLHRSDPNFTDEYRLAAPRLTLDLARDPNTAGDMKVDVRRFVADSGSDLSDVNRPTETPVVTVSLRRQAAGKETGWATLDARELQYEANPDRFTALGPGVIWLHNAVTIQSKTDPNRVLQPCYAQLSNFDILKYGSVSNTIVAEDDAQQLVARYFQLVDGGYGPLTEIVAGHLEAMLEEVTPGRLDLASLVASGGIDYESEAEHRHFSGSEMLYDRGKPLIAVRGDDLRPCYLNGVQVDGIVVNPRTGQVEMTPVTSIFQVHR